MGDRFRSMIESEFAEVDAPPIGDLVDNAIRDGRQLRRTRLVHRTVACAAAVGVLALGLGMATATLKPGGPPGGSSAADRAAGGDRSAAAPATVPASPEPVTGRQTASVPSDAPTMAILGSTPLAPGAIAKTPPASPGVVLLALQSVLPAGATVAFAGSVFDSYTGVQIFLDRGAGFGMIRVAVARYADTPSCERGPPGVVLSCSMDRDSLVETFEIESNCVQRRGATVYRPDGIAVQVNVGSCLVDGSGSAPGVDSIDEHVLQVDEAVRIGNDPIWSDRALGGLDGKARETHPHLPMLTAFNGVGA